MPKYIVNGKTYNIPDDKVAGFESRYPNATVEYHNEGKTYQIPLSKRNGFLKQFPNASYNAPVEQPEQDATPTVETETPEVETPAVSTGETPLTEQDRLRFSAGIEQMKRRTQQSMDDFNERMATMREYHENAPLGGGQTAEGRMMFNPQSGKVEKTYITPLGNRYTSKGLADMESFRYRQAADMSVSGQLRRARLKLAELQAKRNERANEVHDEATEFNNTKLTPLGRLLVGGDIYVAQQQSDPEKNALNVAIRQTEELIKDLEEQQDREQGKDVGFWRGFGRIAGDFRTWDFGMSDLSDAMTMMHADQLTDENATEGERAAYNEMMGAIYNKEQAEQAYGGNASFWNRAGVMTGYMPSFMLDFVITGGGFEGISLLSKGGTRAATKVIGSEVVEEMAEQGFKTYVRNNGIKGFGQYAGNWTIKALGTMGDDLLIRAPLMTNTVQFGKTTSDIIDRKLGDVAVNEDGTYDFSNDKTWGSAIWQGEANSIIENYSEMFGAHLDPVVTFGNMSKLANVIGAKRIGAVLSKADAGALSGIMGQTHQLFNKMGVSDYFGEVTEEYYGQMWRTMLNLDDAYQQNPDGSRTNLLATGKFHGDIWGGMALSMGLMGAGKHTLTAANYASMKHGVNKADSHATELLGKEVWEAMRATIDLTTNDDMGAMAEAIINDKDFTPDERAAVLTYMERTMMMRGFNLATFAQSRGEQDSDVQAMNESYIDGYDMESSQEMNDAKNMLDYQRQRVSALVDEDMLAFMDSNPMNAIAEVRTNGVWNDEARATILDYLNAKQVYDGMLQRVRDDIDGRIDQSNAMVDARVNRSTGMIQGATMKVDDRRVYVVSGNLVPFADGSGIDHNASDESIIIRDAQTGALEQVSPDAVLNIDKALDPYIEKETAAEAISQQYAQEAANRIDGVITFNPGDTYTITGDDAQIQVQIVANNEGIVDNGDGTVNVSDGTNVFPLAKETIQQQAEAAQLARVAQFEQQRTAENAAYQQAIEEESRPQYALNDLVSLRDENGNAVRGNITTDADSDGRYEVYTEAPINGKRVNLFTRDELDSMLMEHNGVVFEQPADNEGNNGGEIIPENGNITPQNISSADLTIPAMQRIPKDMQGNPLYEQTDSDTAWDAIVEQTEGDEAMAQTVADGMVADKEAALKKLEKAKSKGGATIAEKIAAEKERKAAIDAAQQEVNIWKKIAGTANRRKMDAEAERRRVADEAAALRKAEEEKLRAEREEAERIEREALNGVPDMVDDTPQDARARGYRRVSGHKIDRQEPLQALQGKEIAVKFSDSTLPTGRVAVIEAEQLQPSHVQGVRNPLHFIDEAQPKERNDEASVMSARKIAGNIRPEEITSSVTAYTGAPTVNARGEAIQGNNRSDALRLMWESHEDQAAQYKQYLIDHADEFGLNADDVAAMERPVLVNMLDVEDADAITLGQFVAQDTESGGTERIKPKNALQRMGADMRSFANLLLKSADEETSFAGLVDSNGVDVLKWMSQKGYITPTQYKSAFDSKGNLTAEAKNDLRGIMYQSIFKGGSTRLEEMFNAMPAKAGKAILATAFRDYDSPNADRMIEEIQNSIRAFYALSQSEDFVNAKTFKDARLAVEGWKIQYQIDDVTGESYLPAENFSNFALLLATMYKGENQSVIQGTFNKLYDLIQGTQEPNLFEQPDNTPRSLAQAIYETLNITYDGQQRSNVLVGDSSASQRGQQGSTGDAATGERIESGERTADSAGSIEAESTTGGETVHQPQSERKGLEQTSDVGRKGDSTGVADDATQEVLGASNRGDIRVLEEGLDTSYRAYSDDSERTRRTAESERLVNLAKQHGLFIPAEVTKTLTDKVGKRTGESVVYIDKAAGKVTKVKDPYAKSAMKSGVQPEDAAFEHLVHNLLFPETAYTLEGISEEMGDVRIVLSQGFIQNYEQPTKEQIAEALAARGLFPEDNYSFGNELVSVTDVEGDNVLLGEDGTVYFIDPIIRFKKPLREIISTLGGGQEHTPTIGEQVQAAEAEVNTTPTDKQKEAGNYKKGHVQIGTFNVTIEQPRGSVRSGVDKGGKKWEVEMQNTYGYIRGTEGVDGDHIDVFLSNDIDGWGGHKVYVVDQRNADGSFDEHKVMLGFNDINDAEAAYMSNYEEGWQGLGAITGVSIEEFEKWIASSHRKTKAFAEYKSVKTTEGQSASAERRSLAEAPVKAETPTISQESEQVSDQDNAPYTIAPAQYTTKKGKVLDMHLVKIPTELNSKQSRVANSIVRNEYKGWWDKEQGGFMMRSEEDAIRFGEYLADLASQEPVELVSMDDIKAVNNGDVAFTEPKQENERIWQYSIHIDADGYTTISRDDVSSGYPIGDARFRHSTNSPEEMLDILRNPLNGMQEALEAVGVTLENKIKTRELDQKMKSDELSKIIFSSAFKDLVSEDGKHNLRITKVDGAKRIVTANLNTENVGGDGLELSFEEIANIINNENWQEKKDEAATSGNRLVTDERYAELRERMRKKLGGQMNIGIDPEILAIGTEMAVYHLEKGARKFTEFAKAMVADLGDVIRPYLKAFYNGARNLPEVESSEIATDMTSYDEVQTFDIANFDKPGIDAIATAETVTREAEVIQEVEVAQERIKKVRKTKNDNKNSINSQQEQLNLFDNGTENQNTRTDNSGTQLEREELPDTEQVGAGASVEDTARDSKGKRRNAGVRSSELGDRPQYDVNRNYTNEEIEEIVSSVTDIVDGKVVITGEVTNDIKAIARGYKSGGITKKGRGILDEYYTDGKIVDAVNMLIAPYFNSATPIRVLEPSVGIGNFIEAVNNIPTSDVVAFEINETTARIAKVLYPDVDVNLRSFETEFIDESGNKKLMPHKYSLVIGNPPYGSHRGLYKGLGEESNIARYEDYFVKRSLDVLNEGGVLAMVLPSSWMDRHTKFGGYTIERAYRLPSGAFEATQVGTDIVILRKDSSVPVIERAPYFEQHPERVLGEVKERKGRYGRIELFVEGDIDAAIEAIKKENAGELADMLGIEKNNDALNNIESAVDETGSTEKAAAIVKDALNSEKTDTKPATKPSGKQGKYKVELNRGVETAPTAAQFTHEFSKGEVEAFADTDYEGALSNPTKHRRYANYIGGQAIHDFYYAEGDIYSKLAQLEQEKDYIVENYGVEQYEKQKALLESVMPKQKNLDEITISPNTTFVKNLNVLTEGGRVSLKDMFVEFCRKLPRQAFGNSSSWEVVGYVNNEQVHGTDKQRNVLIRERRKRVANDLFNKFLNEELSDNAKNQVVAAFNREYNSTYRPDYSKVPMFSTINKDFKGKPLKLTSVQLAGIGRMTVKGVGVLAHEVGFGKTLSGILAMHEAMTRGFAKKPLIVVPNDNILKQWVETIGEVLPNATVNTLGNLGTGYDLTDFKVNDGEFTIVTYEGLKAMSFSDYTYEHLASKFSYITEDLDKHRSERDIQKEIEKKNELKGKMKRGTKPTYMFEDFGFDWLTVDEVHNANHIVSKVRLDKSVASDFRSQSQSTSDLGLKTWLAAQYIQEENNGRNVLLLSATPFTNKPLEYYSILSLVGNDMLERKGFFNVDQFFATFMEADNEMEIGANGRPMQKTNVRRFRNNGLFQQLLSEFIDIKGEEDNPELVRPERLNKEYKIAQNELTAEAMAAAQELLSDNDTVLQGITHARAAALSPYATSLLGRQPKNHKEFVKNSPKIDATIKMIEQNIKDRPDAGQIIYSEVGVEYFPLIRDYLVKESGLKPSEVRIITGATSNNERVNIQTAFNNGEVKVVIGSPAIKEGLNLQGNTTDMYILSLPWNFTQLRQIEGRGWRQGNRWENIRINYMLTNDSVDVFMLQRLQLKQGLYNEAMKSGAESLDVSDIDTAELKTALITDPAVRAEIVTVQEREKLQLEKTQIEADLSFVMRKYEAYNKLVEKLDSQKNTIKMYRELAKKGDEYWAQRAEREEAQLANIENEIEEEKQNILKKGVNVDDIVRQTEQAQNAIAAIQEKIDNLKEFQEELTQKFREESEAKAKEQGDLVSTYIKERKAENKGGFYRIRPQENKAKATEEDAEDGVLYRVSNEVVETVKEFNRKHNGAAPTIIIDSIETLEEQLRNVGFSEEDIEDAKKDFYEDLAYYHPTYDKIIINRHNVPEAELIGYLWHENAHRAVGKLYTSGEMERVFNAIYGARAQEIREALEKAGYKPLEYAEESIVSGIEELYLDETTRSRLENGGWKAKKNATEEQKNVVEFINRVINFINNGEEQGVRGRRGRTDNTDAGENAQETARRQDAEMWNSQDTGETPQGATGGLTENEIAQLEASTGYTRDEIIKIFGNGLSRQGNGPLTDREVVMESDVYSKVLGKPRYYGKRQREFVARQRRRMTEKARQVAEKLNLDNVEVLESTEGLTGKKATSKGWFDPRTGKITVVVPNHGSTGDIVETVLHEAVAHYGLRKLFGENFKNFLDNVYRNVTPEIRAEITELARQNGWDFHTATEEYLASLAENTNFEKVNPSLWSNIKSFFMKMLAKVGITLDEPLGDNELRYILWRSHQNLVNPGWFNVFGQAEDIAKQYELGVGNYQGENGYLPSVAESDDELYRDGDPEIHERELARDRYERRVKTGMFQSQEALQDSMLGLKEAMQAILGQGTNIEDVDGFENAYLGENRLSSVNKAEADAFAQTLFKPMLDEVAKLARNEAEREELTDYMMAKHGLERNVYMRNEAIKNGATDADQTDYAGLTALTGMDDVADAEAEAQRMVDDYEQAHETADLWEKVNAVSKAILQKSYECGMMSKETFNKVSDMYEFYIPLRGFDEKTSAEAYAYLSHKHSAFNAPIKKAEGRRSKADDPFANLQSMAEGAIMQGNRNKLVKQRFLNFALNHPSDLVSVSDIWVEYDAVTDEWKPVFPDNIESTDTPKEVEQKMQDFETKMESLAQQHPDQYKRGKDAIGIPYRIVESRDMRQHQVVVKRGGRDYVITINGNPRAAQALNGQTNPDNDMSGAIGAILRAGEKINRRLSAFYTTRNPDFIVSNFMRDLLYTNSMAWIKESPNYALRFHKNYLMVNPVTMKRLLAKYRKGTLDMSNKTEAMFHQFMMNGGETGYANIRDIEQHKNDIRKELKRANGKLKLARAWSLLAEKFDELNRAVENCARFAAFVTSREMGRSIDRAIYDAKEISVNFNKKGSGAKFYDSVGQTKAGNASALVSGLGRSGYVFWNAAIQGTTNFGRQMKRHPAKAFTGMAAMFLLGAIVAYLGGDDDEDDKNAYYNLPEYVRRSNILFRAGDSWISIPLPIEYRAIYGMGELMTSVLSGKEHLTGGEIAEAVLGQATQILPIDFLEGGGGLNAFVPSAAKPLWEAYVAEKSWTGMPLYKDTPFNKDMPEWTKAYSSTNKHIVNLAATLNEATGGDPYTKGAIDINPAKVEYMLNGYFGGVFGTIDKLTKTAETIVGDREYDPRSILLVNRLVKAGDERTEYRAVNNEYFRLKEEHDRLKTRLRHYEEDTDNGIFDYAEKIDFLYNSPEYERYEIFEDYRRDIDDLYDELQEAVDDEERKDIEAELNELKKEMIQEMNTTRKRK